MFNRKKFMAQIIMSGKSMSDIANMLSINKVTLYRKINGKSEFNRSEICKLCECLNIKDVKDIFFDK